MSDVIQLTGPLEQRDAWTADRCPIAGTLDVVSTRSAFLLLREAFYGATRFDELARRAQVSEPVAAARLKELVDHGLLAKEPYREPGQRTRQRYRLTEKGADLLPVLVALLRWGDRWSEDAAGVVDLRHAGCGASVEAQLRCADGHEVASGDLELAYTGR